MLHRRHATSSALAVALALAIAGPVHATTPRVARSADPAQCTANVVHPISVRVVALDPIVRGADLRLQVTSSARVPVEKASARLVSAGGALLQSPASVALGSLVPGRTATRVFTVRMPSTGSRFYVQFEVAGQGPNGTLTRGACYNLLPDGPLETGRLVVTPQGQRVLEVAARRIP
jgi:hypothetical protein